MVWCKSMQCYAWNVKIVFKKKPEFGIRIWLNKVVDLAGICSPISFEAFAHVSHLLRLKSGDTSAIGVDTHTLTRLALLVVFNVANSNRLLRSTIKLFGVSFFFIYFVCSFYKRIKKSWCFCMHSFLTTLFVP